MGAAPPGTRPRDLRSSYITVQIYDGWPLTEIAKWAGTSVAMLDKHYAGVIANWDGVPVAPEEQIRQARAELARSSRWTLSGRWRSPRLTPPALILPAVRGKPTPGLEPGTPSLRVKCSTN